MKKICIHILLKTLPIALLIMTAACISDEVTSYQDKGKGLIIMSLHNIQSRTPGNPLFLGDEQVTKVRIFVFTDDVLEKNRLFVSGENSFVNPFVMTVTTGIKDLYVVANETETLTTKLMSVTTREQLEEILADEINSPLAQPIVMTGKVSGVEVVKTPNATQNKVDINLSRIAAQIKLKIKKGINVSEGVDIILQSVHLCRCTSKEKLMNTDAEITGQKYWKYTYTGTGPINVSTEGIDIWTSAEPLYLYENIGSKSDTADRAPYLVVDALYNGVQTHYIAYINDESATLANGGQLDHCYSLKRNYLYDLTAIIDNIGTFDGLILSTYVQPWCRLKTEWLFDWVYTLKPYPSYGNHIFNIENPTDAISFKFKLDNPVGATWNAQLSNPLDFKFSDDNGAVSSGGLGTEYTISIKPVNPQGVNLRTTEFYITVDGTEISLLQGTSLVGEGYRIVINQPALP